MTTLKNYNNWFALKIIFRSSPMLFFSAIFLALLQAIFPFAMFYCFKLIIDSLSSGKTEDIVFIIVLASVLYISSSLLITISTFIKELLTQKLTENINNKIQEKATQLDYAFFESSDYQDLYQRALSEAYFRPAQVLESWLIILQNTIAIGLFSSLLIYLHWSSAIVLLLAAFPEMLTKILFSRISYKWYRSKTTEERRFTYFNNILTRKDFAKEVRLFNLSYYIRTLYQFSKSQYYKEKNVILKNRTLLEIVVQIFSGVLIFGLFAYMVFRTIENQITVGDLVLFFMALQRGLLHLKGLLNGLAGLFESNLFLNDLITFFNLKNVETKGDNQTPFPEEINEITFKDVCFKYPGSEKNILDNLSFTFKNGESIAIVGPNGAGKTTIIKLLCGFYHPTSGTIQINGIDIHSFSKEELFSNMSVIFQDFVLYNLTAIENIGFGKIQDIPEYEKITEAAKRAGIHDVIQGLPKAYQTTLGTLFENSSELSAGEWQKLALARALYRNSKLIILDEPTSSVDAQSEYAFFQKFREASKQTTSVIISHRFNTVKFADRIFVINNGTYCEQGTHVELMQKRGLYYSMFNFQAESYKD